MGYCKPTFHAEMITVIGINYDVKCTIRNGIQNAYFHFGLVYNVHTTHQKTKQGEERKEVVDIPNKPHLLLHNLCVFH